MPFVTRPHFEDRQIVQYNEDIIKLSGTTKIAPVILDFTGTTTGATTVEINGLTGYLNGQRQYGFVVEPAQLKMSGSTGTTEVDVTGYVLTAMDSKGSVGWIALSGGPIGNTYVNSGSVVGNDLILNWNTGGSVPAIALPTSTFTGNTSASCITDIYVKNIHSCSPLNIQPNDEGNVYFGSTSGVTIDISGTSVGIGTTNPTEKLHVSGGDMLLETSNGKFYSDLDNTVGPAVRLSGNSTDLITIGVADIGIQGMMIGTRGNTELLYPGYGKQGDGFLYSSAEQNGLNIISQDGTNKDDYIRFYAGKDANGTTSDIHIQGSGTTKGNVGINTESPDEKLHIQSIGKAKIRLDADTDDIDETETAGILLTQDGGISTSNFGLSPDGINDLVIGVNSTSPPSIKFATRSDGNSFATTADTKMTITNSGSVGIGTTNPTEKLDVRGDFVTINTGGGFKTDLSSAAGPTIQLSGGSIGLPRVTVVDNPNTSSLSMGVRGWSDVLYSGYGEPGDGFIYSSDDQNGLNILSTPGTGTNDYIRFYAGKDANGNTPDIHIQGSGTTKGNVGVGTTNPTEKLHIEGSIKIVDGTQQNGFVLTCDTNGVGSWQPSSGGTSGGTTYWVTSDGGSESIKTDFTSHYINSDNSLMGGGIDLVMSGANNTSNTMLGGEDNKIISDFGFSYRNNILGGESNTMIGRMENSSIFGGAENFLQGYRNSIIGGEKNSINGDFNSIILGGSGNTVSSNINLIGAGESNELAGTTHSAIIGGVGINGGTDNTLYVPNLTVREDKILHSDTVLEVSDLPSSFEDEIKGSYTSFNWTGLTTSVITNSDEFGYTSYILGDLDSYPTNKKYGFVSYYNEGYEKSTSVGSTTSDFYSEKLVLKAASDSEGMVISPHENDGTKALWVEHAGNSIVKILSNGPDGTPRIGVGMDPTGVENALATFQIGGTGNTASFRYLDGQENDGYVLKCDSDGYATWEEESTFTGNTSATCITDLYVSNVYGCSPVTFHNSIQSNGSTVSGDEAIAFGENCTSSDDKTFSFGVNNSVSGERSFIGGGIDNTIGTGNNNFISGGDTNTIGTGNNNSIIGGSNNTISPGVNNSIILGADGITVSKSNQTHTKSLFTKDMSTMAGITVNGGALVVVSGLYLSGPVVTTGSVVAPGPTITGKTTWAMNLTGANTSALPDGDSGQRLAVYVRAITNPGDSMVITPATLNGATTITLTNSGSSVELIYDSTSGWTVMGGNNYTLT